MFTNKLESNIWKFTILLIANKRVFAAFLSAYYLTIPDATAATIGLILLAGNIAGFLFEIPSGYISDKLGHRQTIIASRIIMVLSTTAFLFASSVPFLILGSVLMSISWSFMSGTGSAFMHETLRGLGREDDFTEVMGKVRSIGFAVPIAFMILAPFLISISYQAPFVFGLIVDVVGLLTALLLVAPQVTPEHTKEIRAANFRQVLKTGWEFKFFRYALMSALVAGVLFAVSIYRPPYQVFLDIPLIWFGVLFGVGRGLASLILYFSGRIKKYFYTASDFFRFEIILYTILITPLFLTQEPWIVVFFLILINGFQWGLGQIDISFLVEVIKESKFKATLLSVQGQFKNIFNGILSLILGLVITQTSYPFAFMLITLFFLVTTLPLYIYIKRSGASA